MAELVQSDSNLDLKMAKSLLLSVALTPFPRIFNQAEMGCLEGKEP